MAKLRFVSLFRYCFFSHCGDVVFVVSHIVNDGIIVAIAFEDVCVYVCLQVSYVISAMLVLVTVYFIAPLFESLPLCVLASIIVVACIPLFVHYIAWKRYWQTDRYDFAIWVVSFGGTVVAGVDYGMLIGLGFSVFIVNFRMQVCDVRLFAC